MLYLGDVIEIESSPEPNPRPATSAAKSRGKGKGKATPHRLEPASSVIELTDSESDVDARRVGHSDPDPSSLKRTPIPNLNSNPLNPLDNPPQKNAALAVGSGSGAASTSAAASGSTTKAGPSCAHDHNLAPFSQNDEEPQVPLPITTDIECAGEVEAPPVDIGRDPTIPTPDTQLQIPTLSTTPDLGPISIQEIDPTTAAVAQILEIIPNVEPTHLLELIETHLPTFSVFHEDHDHADGAERKATIEEQIQGVVGHVLHLLFENPEYPKADLRAGRKGKGKRVDEHDDEGDVGGKGKGKAKELAKKPKIDYASIDRPFPGGPNYFDLALYYLQKSFPHIPKPYLRRQLQIHKSLYVPTHLSILAAEKTFDEKRPYIKKSIRAGLRKPQGDEVLEEEKAWLDAELAGGGNAKEIDEGMDVVNEDVVMDDADYADADGSIECQCCFADYPFSNMVQCPEAHLFCSSCISTYASTQLGAHNSSLACIHPSSCSLPFPSSELKRILPVKLYELYERLEQQKEIMQAGLVGLEECPFCEWKCVLEASTEEDKLFRCGNEEGGCGVVSCRGCKKLDHLPKSCQEAEEDKHLDGRHAIEEAMTRALMRNCPTCQKAFIKELGCNKMQCPNCRTLSCYICRQVITGYDHFNQQPGRPTTSANAKKCVLWDVVEDRHAQEVKEAAEKAMEEYRRDHPDIDESAIKVDLQVPAKNAVVAPGVMYPHAIHNPNPNPIVGRAYIGDLQRELPLLFRQAAHHRQQAPQQPQPVPNPHDIFGQPVLPRPLLPLPQKAAHHRQQAPQQPQPVPNPHDIFGQPVLPRPLLPLPQKAAHHRQQAPQQPQPVPNPHDIFGQPVLPRPLLPLPQKAAHHRQEAPQQPQPGPNPRVRAAVVEEQQRQAQQKRHAAANLKAERARFAAQVRTAVEENRTKQRLDRVRDQRAAARREQQERAQLALELERRRQREMPRQPQIQLQPQVPVQAQVQAQAHGQIQHQELYHFRPHVYHHQQAPQPQPPIQHFPALPNPFALAYPGGMQEQPQHQQVMVPPPQVADINKPYLNGRARMR